MTHLWDPDQYLVYADERGRPFVELVARIGAASPGSVVDLGCGPGNLTRLLKERWPGATVRGLDSSAAMVAKAKPGDGLDFEVADLRSWRPKRPVDVIVSNATLQWVPGHLDLIRRLVADVAPGGWLAFQVPGNLDQPSHLIRRDLAAEAPYAEHTVGVAAPDAFGPETYLQTLAGLGCAVDAWETTYLHVLPGDDPVFTWVAGTGARPTLQALPEGLRESFADELKARLRAAYPRESYGTVLRFRRVFVVAQVPA